MGKNQKRSQNAMEGCAKCSPTKDPGQMAHCGQSVGTLLRPWPFWTHSRHICKEVKNHFKKMRVGSIQVKPYEDYSFENYSCSCALAHVTGVSVRLPELQGSSVWMNQEV